MQFSKNKQRKSMIIFGVNKLCLYIRVFGKINFVTNQLGELTMAVDIVHKPPKKIWGHLEQNSGLASRFYFIKEIRKIYKGKCGPSAFFIFSLKKIFQMVLKPGTAFLKPRRFFRHPYREIMTIMAQMAIWPFGQLWPFLRLWPSRPFLL